jgi:tetratricopeptide (TPR) repeat protein
MDTDPFHILGIEPGCDYAAITAAHSSRCRTDPANKSRYDQALLELLGAGSATPGAIVEVIPFAQAPSEVEPVEVEGLPTTPARHDGEIADDASEGPISRPRQARHSSEADALFQRGMAKKQQGDFEGALEAFSAALRADPNHAAALANRGRLLGEHFNHPDQALRDFDALICRLPQSAEAFFLRAKLYAVRCNLAEKAVADFTRAIELKPDWSEAYFQRGLLREAAAELRKALADYSRSVELNPQDSRVYARRASVLEQLGDRRRALLDYDQALRLNPLSPELYLQRGWLLENSNRLHEAYTDYNRAIELAPHLAQAYYSRGKIYAALKQPEKARRDFERAIELDHASAKTRAEGGNR